MDGKEIALRCFSPTPKLSDDERAVLQVLKDARNIFAGEGPNGGMTPRAVASRLGPFSYADEIEAALESLAKQGLAKRNKNGRWTVKR